MFVIGQRPMILAEYEPIETHSRYGVNDIRLGLTGWAQINGRDAVTVEEEARLDGDKKTKGFPLSKTPLCKTETVFRCLFTLLFRAPRIKCLFF